MTNKTVKTLNYKYKFHNSIPGRKSFIRSINNYGIRKDFINS